MIVHTYICMYVYIFRIYVCMIVHTYICMYDCTYGYVILAEQLCMLIVYVCASM